MVQKPQKFPPPAVEAPYRDQIKHKLIYFHRNRAEGAKKMEMGGGYTMFVPAKQLVSKPY
mgnify:CR=1 FL=1